MGVTATSSQSLRLHTQTDDLGQKRMLVTQTKASELDPLEFGDAVRKIKALRVDAITSVKEKNASRIAALQELKAHTQNVRNFTQNLSHYLGVDQSVPNAFKVKIADVRNSNGDDMSARLNITPNNDALAQSFSFEVSQMASCDNVRSTTTFANMDSGLGVSGTLVINGQNIAITDGSNGSLNMSLSDIAAAIKNTVPTLRMTMFSTNGSLFTFDLTSTQTATPINLTGTSANILQNLGIPTVLGDPTLPIVTNQADLTLHATYNGSPITRQSNTIDDLIPNTILQIKGTTDALNCVIDQDSVAVELGLKDFVSSYNAFQDFVQKQTAQNDDYSPVEDSHLYTSSTLRTEVNSIVSALNTWVSGIPDNQPKTLAELGIMFGDQGMFTADSFEDLLKNANQSQKLNIQQDTLRQFLNSSGLSKALAVLGDMGTSSHSGFTVYKVDNLLKNPLVGGQPITLSVQKVNGVIQGTFSVTLKQNAQDPGTLITASATVGAGGLFSGPEGSIFENLVVGCGSKTLAQLVNNGANINTTIVETKGACSQLLHTLDVFLQKDGLLDQEINAIEHENLRLSEEIQRLEEQSKRAEERAMAQVTRTQAIIKNMQQAAESMEMYMQIISARR